MFAGGTDRWNSKLSTNIQCKKKNHPVFAIFQKLTDINKKTYISGIFWAIKTKLQIIHGATYVSLFLSDSNNCFIICLVPYIPIFLYYSLISCFYFRLLFHSFLARRHILQFTMFDSNSLQPARDISEIKNTS